VVPLDYWLLRSIRRNLPQVVVDFMLDRGLYLKPGRETTEPERVAASYAERASAQGVPLAGKTVCVVGYGGGFGVGVHLLERGAARVLLQDPFAPVRGARNLAITPSLRDRYFLVEDGRWTPDAERITLVHEHLGPYARRHPASADLVVSNSVLEHVSDVPALVSACAELTAPGGLNLHLIDLRDHLFRYPFEMLCYRESTWQRWLNASNNLNRLRLRDYEAIFRNKFAQSEVEVVEHLREDFRRARPRIRPEFLTGDEEVDAAAIIRVEARPVAHGAGYTPRR
jgi:SAM-dependent methyltransferase